MTPARPSPPRAASHGAGTRAGTRGTRLRIGTRGSPLALAQARLAIAALAAAFPDLPEPEIVPIRTTGDRIQDRPLADIGGKGLFAKEIDAALLAGEIDLAVHSLKDVETWLPDGITLAAMLPRADPRDALLGAGSIDALPQGARVGTSSIRRRAQLLARRPDLEIVPLRGNVNTRLERLRDGAADAILLAMAGLERLGLSGGAADERTIAVPLAPEILLPAAAQGIVTIACREDDAACREVLAAVDDRATAIAARAERAVLAALDGSCRTPVAAHAERAGEGRLRLRALVATPDGAHLFETRRDGADEDAAMMGDDAGGELRSRAPEGIFAQ